MPKWNKPHTCNECGKVFVCRSSRKLHVATKHSDAPPSFACKTCGKAFTRKSSLNRHVAEKHSDAPPSFLCEVCGKTFTEKGSLDRHVATQHSDTPPSFPCVECGKTFNLKYHLKVHTATQHSDAPPAFPCPECSKTFTKKGSLDFHVATQHSNAPPAFPCEECGKTFTCKTYIKQHLANVHDVGVTWHVCDADPERCQFQAKTNSNLQDHIQRMHARVYAQRKQEQEERVRKALLAAGWQEHKLAESMPPVGYFRREKRIDFQCAKKAQPGALATSGQYARLDFVLGVKGGGYVFLEVDEHQHRFGYDNESLSCDMKRMASVVESLAIETSFDLPSIYWLRYNPHAHRVGGDLVSVPKAEREARLVAWLAAFECTAPLGLGYAFYDYDDADGGLEVLGHPEYAPQYAALADNLAALDAVPRPDAGWPASGTSTVPSISAPDAVAPVCQPCEPTDADTDP